MRIDEIEQRKAEIRTMLDGDVSGLDIDALTEEVRSLDAETAELKNAAAQAAELRKAVTPEVIAEIKEEKKKEERKMENIEIRNTPEYIEAFAKYVRTGKADECRALLTENATNGTIAVPAFVDDVIRTAWDEEGIMSLVKKTYLKGNLKVGFEISATGAVKHAEGAQVTEETLVLGIRELIPASIKKWVSVSDEALDLSGRAYLEYIYAELTHQIAKKAADELIADIEACDTVSTTTCPGVPVVTAAEISLGTIASAIGALSDAANNPVVIMNKATMPAFKAVQYGGNYGADPFEGLTVLYNNTITAYSAATTGDTYVIVGDLGYGAQANFPNGNEITFKYDDLTLADYDLVRIIGREFVGLGVVAPNAFVKVQK